MTTIKEAIASLLAAQEPCTLGEIVRECSAQCDERTSELMPVVVIAIAEMIGDGTICGYDQEEVRNGFDYAWILSEDPAPLTRADIASRIRILVEFEDGSSEWYSVDIQRIEKCLMDF